MVVVAQLVRAPDCGSGGRRFETDLPPLNNKGLQKCSPFFNKNLPTNLPLKFIQILQNAKKCFLKRSKFEYSNLIHFNRTYFLTSKGMDSLNPCYCLNLREWIYQKITQTSSSNYNGTTSQLAELHTRFIL